MRDIDDVLKEGAIKTKEEVLQYAHDSLNGVIPQGKHIKWAMTRFLNDLEKTKEPESKYYFDWDEVYKFREWSKLFKHTKGVLAGEHIDLHISVLWEFANILGFKHRSDGTRRFREAEILKARKNMKTQSNALITSYIAFLSEEQEEVYIAGWSREQSNICYNEMVMQIKRASYLKDTYKETYGYVTVLNNGSTVKALSREAKRFGDGTNPSLAIIDEFSNSHETSEIVDVLKSGMVARDEPLTMFISTAGFNLHYPAYEYYRYCSDIVNPETDIENDEIFVAIYQLDEGDDIKDESNWIKANPIVATYEQGLNSLRSGLKKALDQPSEMRNFLTKNMNMWVDQKDDGFMSLTKWNKQEYKGSVEEFLKGASLYYGFDLSAVTDLTALGWVAVKNGKFLVGQHSYMPEEKFKERMSRDKIRFDLFVDRGELTLTEGATVDYKYLKRDLLEMCNKYGVKEVGFDKWNANYFATELANEGMVLVDIPQSISALSEPTKKFKEKVYNGSLFHTGDTLLKWAIGNAVVVADANENIKIHKTKSKDRIDPVDGVINAFARAMFDDQIYDLNEMIRSGQWTL